ncbi:MAG: TonB-dependent receptor [Acidobacteriota bacterium]
MTNPHRSLRRRPRAAGPRLAFWLGLVLLLLLGLPFAAAAQDDAPAADASADDATADADETPQIEDVIVVTASRTEQRLQEVPVAMSVITAAELETTPADDYGDVLRSVPGINVAQISARDVQINGRGATNSLSNGQLVLLDGRSVYLDFFGFVMWDLLPVDFREIAQVEVVRGPGSAVWGANALGGVVNLITKSPWEMVGTGVQLTGGELGTLGASITHAQASDVQGFKLSASYYEQDAYDRPTGVINETGTPYPPFDNEGTAQPKIDLRYDRNIGDGAQFLTVAAGWATTDGIVHSGIGPFNVDDSSGFSYAKVDWSIDSWNISAYANLVDGDAINQLTRGLDGLPLQFLFETETYNLEASNTAVVGRNTFTYGGNVRHTDFDLSIAPGDDARDEYGFFLQDEIELTDRLTWLLGARWDDIDPIGSVVSPRTSLLFAPTPEHSFRISYNEAFRAPSLVENFLDTTIVNDVQLPVVGQYVFPTLAVGNPLLQEESLTAYEVGYVGTLAQNRATLQLAVYRNEIEDATDFFPAAAYTGSNPPLGWPLPPFFLDVPPLAGALPSLFTYRNIGERVDQGFEAAFDYRPNLQWRVTLNYSYQDEPDVEGIDPAETNIAPENRFNLGVSYDGPKYYADLSVNYVDEARWTDVLDSRFWGTTDDYTILNLSVGIRLANDKVTLALIGNNITDEDVQQHIFGDIISRKITGQVRFEF